MILLSAALAERRRFCVRWRSLLLLATFCGLVTPHRALAADELDLRLHLAWGGGEAQQWSGRVIFSSGQLSGLRLLGIDSDQPGSIHLRGQQILIRQQQARSYDGLEVSVRSDTDAKVRIELLAAGELQARVIEVPLIDLVGGYRSETLDELGNRLVIRRSPADLLRVEISRDHLVYAPGETFRCAIHGHRLSVAPDSALRCRLTLKAPQSRNPTWEDERRPEVDQHGSWLTAEEVEIELPEEEGVYDLEVTLSTRRRPPAFPTEKVMVRRRVQLVVVADQPVEAELTERRLVVGIDPTQANWFQRMTRLPQWSLLPGFRADGPLGNVKAEHVERGQRLWTSMPVGAWQAYPLPVDEVGALHELELEYAGDAEQAFAVSLVEPDAAGKVIPIGLDSGTTVSSQAATSIAVRPPQAAHHRLLFWPKTKTPLLLITNLSDTQPAVYGRFDVYRRSLPAVTPATPGHRLTVAYFERPLFPEAYGAAEVLDAETGRSLEDWQTFLDGSRRMIQYAKYVGYDALAMTCVSEGSTLYPSALLQPTPKHDRGVFFTQGQDPVRKDVMEMMFRLCDREGVQLIPVVEFATPLPALEAQLLQPESAEGIALVDASQATWRQRFESQRGRAAYYNPLDDRVQQAMLDVIDELLVRYSRHRSFAGVTINLHADGYTQLPDIEWGMDARTWDRFRRERQVRLSQPDQLDPSTQDAWLDWRCERLGRLYVNMAQRLATHRPDARLYLAGSRLIESRPMQRSFRPSLPPQVDLDRAMREIGFAPQTWANQPNIVLLRPRLFVSSHTPPAGPATAEFNRAPAVEQYYRQLPGAGAQFLHEPHLMRLPSFDEVSPFGKSNTFMSLVAQLSPSGVNNRQRFAHALAAEDASVIFEGGWMLPMGQEETLRSFLQVYRQLPQSSFDAVDGDRQKWQPLRVRSLSTDDATYLYVVNDSPWYIGADARLAAPSDAQFVSLDASREPGVRLERDGAVWNLTLAPFDVLALRASRPQVRVVDVTLNLPPDVKPALENRIRALAVRASQLGNPEPLAKPDNRGFERWDATSNQPEGWLVRGRSDVVTLDSSEVHEGKSALRVALPNGSVSLRSAPVQPPDSGRLSVSIWARVADPDAQPRVRLVLEVDGRVYHPWSPIGVGGADRVMGKQWKEFVFRVSQLPTVNDSLKIGVEIAGTGEVFLDEMRLYDILVLDASEHKALAHLVAGADYQLRKGLVADCLRILDGYWPQYLIDNVSEAAPEIADRPTPLSTEPTVTPPPREASAWDRLKRLVPLR